MKRRVRRFRLWLGRLILPANAVVVDLGPVVDSYRQLTQTANRVGIELDELLAAEKDRNP
jgi:hypothetical protein